MKQEKIEAFEAEFDREIAMDDDSASREMLASGRFIHITRSDTPSGHVVRVHPDGREVVIPFDREAMDALIGS